MNNPVPSSRISSVRFTDASLVVSLADGREISTPLSWYPKLLRASQEERGQIEITPLGLHWPKLDEDLSLDGMLAGRAAAGGDVRLR